MPAHPASRIADCFVDLADPRIDRTRRHHLLDIVTIAVCAVICGADTWVDVADWGRVKRDWLTEWLELPHGIPSHDTFGRVFARIDPAQFEAGFLCWVQDIVATAPPEAQGRTGVIAIDGKTARRSGDAGRGQSPLHLVSASACAHRLVLAQEAVDQKSNEIIAIPQLLERLVLTDQIVTIDAMGCQREIARQIVAGGGDYVLALKENQPTLWEEVHDTFAMADMFGPTSEATSTTVGKEHGRQERRQCDVIAEPATLVWLDPGGAWTGLRSIARVTAVRQVTGQAPTTTVR